MMLCATESGTARFRHRHADLPGHFRRVQGLWLSSIGLGTYLGEPTDEVDADYTVAVSRALERGCNVIDTASSYRFQRSERAIGAALKNSVAAGRAARDEIVIAAKGGYVPFDGDCPSDPARYIRETFVETGLVAAQEIVDGHCLSPGFLRTQIEQSQRNLGLDRLDIYYLHNPESQLEVIGRNDFRERLQRAFAALEEVVDEGGIRFYGTATWNGYRNPAGSTEYLSLEDVVSLARDLRGLHHHFRFIQLPYNLAMLEAVATRNQRVNGELMTTLEAASQLGVSVMGSASLLQGRLLNQIPDSLRDQFKTLSTDAQRCLQFARSTPGLATALVGMSHLRHIDENLATAHIPPLTLAEFRALFS